MERIKRLSEERDEENWRFRTFLKGQAEDEVDGRVHRLYEEVAAEIDCTTCGNCCGATWPCVSGEDVDRLAKRLLITPEAFEAEYTCEVEEGVLALEAQPCRFLEDKRCTVYSDRPEVCRSYPHLHKPGFVFRLTSVISNCAVCPIVFNVFERLKDELRWRRPG